MKQADIIRALRIPKNADYWRRNRPISIGDSTIDKEIWNKSLDIVARLNKPVNFRRLSKLYHKENDTQLFNKIKHYKKDETRIHALKEHYDYVKFLYDQEKKRQDNLDNKAKQNITNVSLLIGIISLTFPFIVKDKGLIAQISNWTVGGLLTTFLFLIITLILAVVVLKPSLYNRPQQRTIFNPPNFNQETFIKERAVDFFVTLTINMDTNSKKSKFINWSNYSFLASILFVLVLSGHTFWLYKSTAQQPKEDKAIKVNVSNPTDLEGIQIELNRTNTTLDSLKSRIDKIENKIK